MTEIIRMKLLDIQPSQLYINRGKFESVQDSVKNGNDILPVPVIKFKNGYVFTDGHTRALVSYIRSTRSENITAGTQDVFRLERKPLVRDG